MNYSYDEILNKDIMQILSRLPLKALREKSERLWTKRLYNFTSTKKGEPAKEDLDPLYTINYLGVELGLHLYEVPQFKKAWIEKEWDIFDEKLREGHRRAIRKIAKEFIHIV